MELPNLDIVSERGGDMENFDTSSWLNETFDSLLERITGPIEQCADFKIIRKCLKRTRGKYQKTSFMICNWADTNKLAKDFDLECCLFGCLPCRVVRVIICLGYVFI